MVIEDRVVLRPVSHLEVNVDEGIVEIPDDFGQILVIPVCLTHLESLLLAAISPHRTSAKLYVRSQRFAQGLHLDVPVLVEFDLLLLHFLELGLHEVFLSLLR